MRTLHKNHRFTIRRTLVVNEPFGMHKCIPYANNSIFMMIRNWILTGTGGTD